MEKFKIDIFNNNNNNKSFPFFEIVTEEGCNIIETSVLKKLHFIDNDHVTPIEILKYIREKSKLLLNINAQSGDFNFEQLINNLLIEKPDYININWNDFENIDRFKFNDFSNYFSDIWYAGPDDIELFPDDISWIICIDAIGDIFLYT